MFVLTLTDLVCMAFVGAAILVFGIAIALETLDEWKARRLTRRLASRVAR